MQTVEQIDPAILELFEFRPRKGDIKKVEIVLAAIDCLATIGLEKTTYEAIAKKVGTRRAHVAYHFGDKNDIFLHCIKFIVANYQQASLEHIKRAKSNREMLLNYIEGPFLWARDNPEQLTVMLLFYYFCCIKQEYLELHQQIRQGGVERIQYILTNLLRESSPSTIESPQNNGDKRPINSTELSELAKGIQNLMSGHLLDARTTQQKGLEQAAASCQTQALELINRSILK